MARPGKTQLTLCGLAVSSVLAAIVLACARDLAGPLPTHNKSVSDPEEVRVAATDATASSLGKRRETNRTRQKKVSKPGFMLGDGNPVVHVAEFNDPASGENVQFEFKIDGSGNQISRVNLYNQGQRYISLDVQWASNTTDLASVTQTAYNQGQAGPMRQSGMSCGYLNGDGQWTCTESYAGPFDMRLPIGEAVHGIINKAVRRVSTRDLLLPRLQGSTPTCDMDGVRGLLDWVMVAVDAKHAYESGGKPTLTAPSPHSDKAFACLLYFGKQAADGTVDQVKEDAKWAIFTAGVLSFKSYGTANYIWDTYLRPMGYGQQVGSEMWLKSIDSCNATWVNYICTSLSSWFNMQ